MFYGNVALHFDAEWINYISSFKCPLPTLYQLHVLYSVKYIRIDKSVHNYDWQTFRYEHFENVGGVEKIILDLKTLQSMAIHGEDTIKMDFKDTLSECVNWILWFYADYNFGLLCYNETLGSIKVENFLTSWATTNVQQRP